MKITWNGHACFTVETAEGTVVLDPFADGSVPGFEPLRLKADLVLCSHEHGDHSNRAAVRLSGAPCGVAVEAMESWHDDVKGAKRGPNTFHVLKAEGMRVAHLGDLGCDLTEEQVEKLLGADVLMIPIGGYYTIDSAQALKVVQLLKPRVTLPMHYRDAGHGFPVISTSEEFRAGCLNPVQLPGREITVDAETKVQTVFFTL
ncbi:MAG: MBL fold metallo-hydrolase [Oscillospiraceae bacterium]|nr:MBL fold metallo-hydrolase [Oscillospiraceae bacterium]